MAVVKGSEQELLEIRPYSPRIRWRNRLLFVLAIVALVFGAYVLGGHDSSENIERLESSNEVLKASLDERNEQITHLTQQASVLEKGGEVDRQSMDSMRETVKNLKSELAKLQEDVTFYKGIMAPNGADKGLRVSKIKLSPSKEGRFRYSVMMTQVSDNTRFVRGIAAINVVGESKGKSVVIPMRDLDPKVKKLGMPFRFRYYQELSGEFALPPKFTPQQLQVVLKSTGAKSQRLEKTSPWPSAGGTKPANANGNK